MIKKLCSLICLIIDHKYYIYVTEWSKSKRRKIKKKRLTEIICSRCGKTIDKDDYYMLLKSIKLGGYFKEY